MNSLVRMPTQGNWFWDGSQWTCDQDCLPCPPNVPPFPCPPPGFPPPGCPPWFGGMNSPPWYPGANAGVSFGTTAPPNPVRGHFWWNGLGLAMFDGAVWVDTVNGKILTSTGSPGHPGLNGGGGGGGGQPAIVFSPTAPPAPTQGLEWWNGTVLQMWDGTVWKTIGPGSGGVVPTTTVTFALSQPSAVAVGTSAAAWTVVPFNTTPQIDTQNAYNSSNHRITPTVAGIYNFGIRGRVTGTACGIAVVKNDPGTFTGSLSSDIIVAIAATTATGWVDATGFAQMNGTTDYVRYWAYETTGLFPNSGASPIYNVVLFP